MEKMNIGGEMSIEWISDVDVNRVLVYKNGAQVACLQVGSVSDMWNKLFSMFPETSPF